MGNITDKRTFAELNTMMTQNMTNAEIQTLIEKKIYRAMGVLLRQIVPLAGSVSEPADDDAETLQPFNCGEVYWQLLKRGFQDSDARTLAKKMDGKIFCTKDIDKYLGPKVA